MRCFSTAEHSARLMHELSRVCSRKTGFRARLTVKCSDGWEASEVYGAVPSSALAGGEMRIPCIDQDKALALELRLTSDIPGHTATPVIQCVVSYTGWDGVRRVRVMTLAVTTSTSIKSIFRVSRAHHTPIAVLVCIPSVLTALPCVYLRHVTDPSCSRVRDPRGSTGADHGSTGARDWSTGARAAAAHHPCCCLDDDDCNVIRAAALLPRAQ